MKNKLLKLGCLASAILMTFSACGDFLNEGHTHTFSETWSSNATHHWHAATCAHGENKEDNAEHVDVDEDGVCDVCTYQVGHTHTFAAEWSYDEENHWKAPTCTHTGEFGEKDKHVDENTDGACDVCSAHVHVINTFGFCMGCDKETKPVDENVLGSVVYATFARAKHVVGGNIDYHFKGINNTDETIDEMQHTVDFSLGTNGLYMKRSYQNAEDKAEAQEDYIAKLPNGDATGITVWSVENQVVDAQPSSFNGDSLKGYYYAVSTLSDGHGAEEVLKSLYEQSQQQDSVQNFTEEHDAANKKYSFAFDTLIVHETLIAQGDNKGKTVYNVNYFEVEVSFTYNQDYALTSLTIDCDCYTNDPGSKSGAGGLELMVADVDLDYNPADGTFKLRDTAAADNYKIAVTQTTGTRGEITLKDGSEYAPTDFVVKKEDTAITELNAKVGQYTTLSIAAQPETAFMSFAKNDMKITVTDEKGDAAVGVSAIMQGANELNVYCTAPGEYVVTITYREVVKTINVTVTGVSLGGAKNFEVEATDNSAWNQTYTFKATVQGEYTFYLPYGVGAATYTSLDNDGDPILTTVYFDYENVNPESGIEGTVSFAVNLRAGQSYKFCFKFRNRNMTYTIGYDEPTK